MTKKFRVAYTDSYRILHTLPQWTSACLPQIECPINTFNAILRKTTFSFTQRCQISSNNLINSLITCGCFYESNFYVDCNNLLFGFA